MRIQFSVKPADGRRLLGVFLAVMMVTCGSAIEAGRGWVRAKSEFAEVLTDGSQKDAVEFCVQYSAFRYALAEMVGERMRKLPPTVIVLFRSEQGFERYFPPRTRSEDLVSVTATADGVAVQGLTLTRNRERGRRAAFEFETTWTFSRAGLVVPLWVAQGTGKVFSTLTTRGEACLVGDYHASSLKDWVIQPIPWPRFFAVTANSHEYLDRAGPNAYHSQAWSLMHYLWLNDDRGPERFRKLMERLFEDGPERALEAALELPLTGLTERLKWSIGRVDRTREIPFDIAGLRRRMETGPADPVVVAVRLADLLSGFLRQAEAAKELATARAQAPEHPLVLEAMARHAATRGDRRGAVEFYRQAIARGSDNVLVHVLSAESWLNDTASGAVDEAGGGGIFADKAIADARRALELEPGSDPAYRALARAYFARPEITTKHIEELTPGVEGGDPTGAIRYYRALLHARLKEMERFKAELAALVAARGIRADLQQDAAERLGQLTYNDLADRVEQLVTAGKFAEARAVVTQARTGLLREAEFQKRLGQVEQWIDGSERAQKEKSSK